MTCVSFPVTFIYDAVTSLVATQIHFRFPPIWRNNGFWVQDHILFKLHLYVIYDVTNPRHFSQIAWSLKWLVILLALLYWYIVVPLPSFTVGLKPKYKLMVLPMQNTKSLNPKGRPGNTCRLWLMWRMYRKNDRQLAMKALISEHSLWNLEGVHCCMNVE